MQSEWISPSTVSRGDHLHHRQPCSSLSPLLFLILYYSHILLSLIFFEFLRFVYPGWTGAVLDGNVCNLNLRLSYLGSRRVTLTHTGRRIYGTPQILNLRFVASLFFCSFSLLFFLSLFPRSLFPITPFSRLYYSHILLFLHIFYSINLY